MAAEEDQRVQGSNEAADVNDRAGFWTRKDVSQPWQEHLPESFDAEDTDGNVALGGEPGEVGQVCSASDVGDKRK